MCPEISVIVPLYNEAENVQPLARALFDALSPTGQGIELIFVDDGSTDETSARILQAQRTDSRIRWVHHPTNRGQSAALFSGFRASQGSIIATLDGDLQNDPADLPRLIGELGRCDMVCGVRIRRADGRLRRISSRIARWARKLVLGVDFADTGCNLRVFKRRVLETLPGFNGVHRFAPILAQSGGAVVAEIPVSHHPRSAGRSKYGVFNRLGPGIFDLVMVAIFIRRQIKVDFQNKENPQRENFCETITK